MSFLEQKTQIIQSELSNTNVLSVAKLTVSSNSLWGTKLEAKFHTVKC
jgi:hypothetical protein